MVKRFRVTELGLDKINMNMFYIKMILCWPIAILVYNSALTNLGQSL